MPVPFRSFAPPLPRRDEGDFAKVAYERLKLKPPKDLTPDEFRFLMEYEGSLGKTQANIAEGNIQRAAQAYRDVPGFTEEAIRGGKPIPGAQMLKEQTRITRPFITPGMVGWLPGPVQPVGRAVRELSSPVSLATLPIGAMAQPLVRGPMALKLAAEAGLGVVGGLGAEGAARLTENAPAPIRTVAPIVGGLAAGIGALKAPAVARGVGRGVQGYGKALMETAPSIGPQQRQLARGAKKGEGPSPELLGKMERQAKGPTAAKKKSSTEWMNTLSGIDAEIKRRSNALNMARGAGVDVNSGQGELNAIRQFRRNMLEGYLESSGRMEEYEEILKQLHEATQAVQARGQTAVIRPSWATGLTNDELVNIAKQEGRNPYQADWGDAIDPVVVSEAKKYRSYKSEAGSKSTSEMQALVGKLRDRLATIEKEVVEDAGKEDVGLQRGFGQAGMGIGEKPSQGGLFENLGGETATVPLIDPAKIAARQEQQRLRALGQQELVPPPSAPAVAPPAARGGLEPAAPTVPAVAPRAATEPVEALAALSAEHRAQGITDIVTVAEFAARLGMKKNSAEFARVVADLLKTGQADRVFYRPRPGNLRLDIKKGTLAKAGTPEPYEVYGLTTKATTEPGVGRASVATPPTEPSPPLAQAAQPQVEPPEPKVPRKRVPKAVAPIQAAIEAKEAVQEASPKSITAFWDDIYRAADEGSKEAAALAGGPPPRKPPPEVSGHIGPAPDDPEGNLVAMLDAVPGEEVASASYRKYSGARKADSLRTVNWAQQGQDKLVQAGLAKKVGKIAVVTDEPRMRKLFQSLHGEGPVPQGLEVIYQDMRAFLAVEGADTLAFDPGMKKALMAHPDYFPRGWKAPKETKMGQAKMGATPFFKKPRNDATFTEMLDAGWEPVSWNPYIMAALRRQSGVEYREGLILLRRLRKMGKALPVDEVPDKGEWRVPRAGPAFEGRPFVGEDGKVSFTTPIAVRNNIADKIESIYGFKPSLRLNGHDVLPYVRATSNFLKGLKLIGSGFQHLDVGVMRTGGAAIVGAVKGKPGGIAKYPSYLAHMMATSVSEGARRQETQWFLSKNPIGKSGVTPNMIVEEGLSVEGDISMFRRSANQLIEDTLATGGASGSLKQARLRAKQANEFFAAGLFEGVYRSAMKFSLENAVIPALERAHPNWTARQIAGSAATETNKMMSALGDWQTVFSQPAMKEFAHTVLFSANESESWARMFFSAFKGPNRRFWMEYTAGTVLFMAVLANAINFAFTGKVLPWSSYAPVEVGDRGVAYNGEFLSPSIGEKGKDGRDLKVDIVGQADTVIRWMVDPVGALQARENVIPRMLSTQIKGKTFYGDRLETTGDRARAAAYEALAPIGLGNVGEAARQRFNLPLPKGEERVGQVGALIQASGLNMRAAYPIAAVRRKWQQELSSYRAIPANEKERVAKRREALDKGNMKAYETLGQSRDSYLKANPDIDAALYLMGERESLQTGRAIDKVVAMIREYGVNPADVKGLKEEKYESDQRKVLREIILAALRRAKGQPSPKTAPAKSAAPKQSVPSRQVPVAGPTKVPVLPNGWTQEEQDFLDRELKRMGLQ